MPEDRMTAQQPMSTPDIGGRIPHDDRLITCPECRSTFEAEDGSAAHPEPVPTPDSADDTVGERCPSCGLPAPDDPTAWVGHPVNLPNSAKPCCLAGGCEVGDRGEDCCSPVLGRHASVEEMPLFALLHAFKDGDERGWQTEFDWLESNHCARLDRLTESVQRDGIQEPILLGNDGRVWDGHHRLAVAARLGLRVVPVLRTDPDADDTPPPAAGDVGRAALVALLHGQHDGNRCIHWATGSMCERWADTILASDWLAARDAEWVEADKRIAASKAEAWEEGFDAGERDVMEHEGMGWRDDHPCIPNPYRAARIEACP